jgi:hypothetical protein
LVRCGILPDDSFIVKLLYVYRFYPDSIDAKEITMQNSSRLLDVINRAYVT